MEDVEKDGVSYPIEPPLECEIMWGECEYHMEGGELYIAGKWSLKCDLIEVEGCDAPEEALEVFNKLLREAIVDGKVRVLMDAGLGGMASGGSAQ